MTLRTLAAIMICAGAISLAAIEPQELITKHQALSAKELAQQNHEKEMEKLALTEQDYIEVAKELGVEVAAIKAVVEVEAGRAHEGFFAPGKPLINFDLTMFRQFARRNGVALSKYTGSHSAVFRRPNARRHGSQQAAQQHRLEQAKTIDEKTAIQGTFWGMFQLGGFNWKLCGTSSPKEFVELMSRSERDQLDLFARFITNTGLVKYLRAKNWARFAKGYNGPSYAARGYHTKMAKAYARHRVRTSTTTPKEENAQEQEEKSDRKSHEHTEE